MQTFTILNRYTDEVIYTTEAETLKDAVEKAVKEGAYLYGADLYGADLRGADLRGAYLRGADLRGAYLQGANLQGANLQDADLRGAYLQDADLRGADLRGAYLRGAIYNGAPIVKTPVCIQGLTYNVTIIGGHMVIGCQTHKITEWQGFDDARILEMDGKQALRFWREHKDTLMALCVGH